MADRHTVYSELRSGDVHIESSHRSGRASFSSIFAFTNKSHLRVLIPALFLALTAGTIKPILAIFLGRIFEDLANFGSSIITGDQLLQNVSVWCTALTGLGIGTIVVNGGFFGLWLIFGEMQARSIRDKSFRSMLNRDMKWYDLQADGIGSLLIRIQTQIRELQIATSQPLGFLLEDVVVALSALGIAFYYSWNLTLVILACVPLTAVIIAATTRRLQPAVEWQKRDLNEASKYSHIAIREVDTVKAFNGQDREIWQYKTAVKKAAKSYMIQANANSLQIGTARFMTTAMFVVGFSYGVVLVRDGLSSGKVLTTFYSCLMATQAMEALLPQWLVISKGTSAGQSLKDLLLRSELDWKLSKSTGNVKPGTCHGDVEVSNLTFSYPSNPGQPVIKNASFFFPAGETTFVIGRSGSGKSTLGNLLMKFYKPSSGQLLLDGKSLDLLDLDWLRSNICFVQQESVLFNESIFRNIAFGRKFYSSVTEHEVKMASQMAMLQDTISDMPEGLQTVIGQNGNLLSGGQTQRVALARARLHDAPILILDEATSALDPITRSLIMDCIRIWRKAKTTIIITHDVSDIMEKDYVYVLEEGNIIQEGYRRQLIGDTKGTFASFVSITSENSQNHFYPDLRTAYELKTINPHGKIKFDKGLYKASTTEGDWQRRWDHRSHLRHFSQFLGLEDASLISANLPYGRISRGIGVGSLYANTRYEDISLGVTTMPSISRSINTTILKRNITRLLPENIERAHLRNGIVSNDESTEFETLDMRGKSSKQHRSQTTGPRQIRSPKDDTLHDSESANYLDCQCRLESGSPRDPTSLNNDNGDFTLIHILRTVWPILREEDRFTFVLGFLNALISATATPAFSYVFARLLGTYSLASGQASSAETWALVILAIAIADGISSYYMHYFLEYSGQTWVDTLRVEAFKRIIAQPKLWFSKPSNNPERLNECLDRYAEEMRNLVGPFAGYVFLACCMMSIAIVWAFILCWKLTLVVLASGPCMYAFTRAFEGLSGKWEKKLNEMSNIIGEISAETLLNIKTVRALTLETYFIEKHTRATSDTYNVGMRRAAYTSVLFGLSDSTNTFVIALILYYGTVIVASGSWNAESVLQVITLLIFSSGNANAVVALIPQISSSRTTGTQMLRLANMPKVASYESQGVNQLSTPLPIHFNSLSFAYPMQPNVRVLNEISLEFPQGSCTAIVGPSGSGKSTIATLLLGLQPPTEPLHPLKPSLTFAGMSIFSCNMNSLRSQMALVTQNPVLFPCSVTSNISYGLPAYSPLATPNAIQASARAAGIHDFIVTLPQGYDTIIGEGGRGLSGGQAQRLCIARALVRRPKVLILDEPTSALDGESASIIKNTILQLTGDTIHQKNQWDKTPDSSDNMSSSGMAVILITHSIDMMRAASRIYVLEKGRVVQDGSFEELAQTRGSFSKLISRGR